MEATPYAATRALIQLPKRSRTSQSTNFKKIELLTNHYEVSLSQFKKIVIFRTKITPQIAFDNQGLRRQIFDNIKPELKKMIKNPVISGFNVYSHEEPNQSEKVFHYNQYSVNIKQVKLFNISENQNLLLSFLNNSLKNVMQRMNYVSMGKTGKYINTGEKKDVDSLYIYDGFKVNFVKLQKGLFLRVDSAKKVVRTETVLDFIDNFYKINKGREKQDVRNMLKAQLTNKIIMTNYGKARYERIEDIVFKKIDQFMLQNNVNLASYYLDRYKIKIHNLSQPLLKVQSKKQMADKGPMLLIPQLCLMTGIPDSFDEMRRKKISQISIKNPPEKVLQIGKLMKSIKNRDQLKDLKDLGININTQMHKFNASLIPVPRLALGKQQSVEKGKQAFFNLFNKPIFANKHFIKCGIINFEGLDIQQLINTFTSTSRNLQTNFEYIPFEVGKRGITKDFQSKIQSAADKQCNIILIILPPHMRNDYKKLKNYTIKNGIITQIMTEMTLRKKNLQSIATKVLLQIIAKRGNILWVPKTEKNIKCAMLIGFDTSKTSFGATLISACATINSTFSTLFSTHNTYDKSEDKYKSMCELTMKCLQGYQKRNQFFPDEVIIFLNSCSGDQISLYHEFFFNPLLIRVKQIFGQQGQCLHFTAIMVNTKNSERFFLQSGQTKNVPAGTLVSSGLVSENYDFYIISQQSNRGSTVPNHYKVIFTTSDLDQGALQQLIFSQCFNYVNWTGSIKVPGILQYAKKCSKFLGDILELEDNVSKDISNRPYFV